MCAYGEIPNYSPAYLVGWEEDSATCLKASGDSMVEATLKRFFYYTEKNIVILKAENPAYEDLIFINEELNNFHILGKAVAFQSDK